MRHPVVRAMLALAVGFVGAFVVIQAVERLGPAERVGVRNEMVLGVPDLSGYCSREHDGLLPLLVAPDPYGWECAGPIENVWTSTVIDVDAVCRWQYDEPVRAHLTDPERPESWRCVTDG